MESNIFLGLGSNKGNRLEYLRNTVVKIKNCCDCRLMDTSSIYETKPLGNIEQENYLNAVIKIDTNFSAKELFYFVKNIEVELGRQKSSIKWAPREIDVDILFYNQLIYNEDNLIIPHSEILKRDFVIIPLLEIDRSFYHPILKNRIEKLDLTQIEKHIIRKIDYKLI